MLSFLIKALRRKQFLFNLHLILSIIFAVPLLLIGVTGAILSYQHELDDLISLAQNMDNHRLSAKLEKHLWFG